MASEERWAPGAEMINPKKQSAKIIISYIVGLSIIVPIANFDWYVIAPWSAISIIGWVMALKFSLVLRPCGHSFITSWGPFFFPFVINPCPRCGDDLKVH